MITLDLRTQKVTLDELFEVAAEDSVHVIAKDGNVFVLEQANEFEQEVAQLGQSQTFMAFLAERARETGGISLEEALRRQDQREQRAEEEH